MIDLFNGDSLKVLTSIPDNSADVLLTDPPYSSGGMTRGDRMMRTATKYVATSVKLVRPDFAGDTRDQYGFTYWATLWLLECWRIIRPGGMAMVFSDWRQIAAMTNAFQAAGWVWRGIAVWDKGEATRPQRGRFRAQSEFIVWGTKGPHTAPPNAPCLPGVFRFPISPKEKKMHITAKPVPLLKELLKLAPHNAIVLDPFAGSGSTGVAAQSLGLQFIGIELDPVIFSQAAQRLKVIQQQQELFR